MTRKVATRGSIDRGTIVKVALKLLDKHGIEGVSTRKVAEALGIAGPSLYWHFPSKRVLLDHMAEAMLAAAMPKPHPVHSERDWRRWFKVSGHAIRKAALSHRDGAQVLAGARPTGTHPDLDREAMIARLRREGFSAAQAPCAMRTLSRFALGWAISEQSDARLANPEAAFAFGLDAIITGLDAKRKK
jgi:TetR/AcrR family tetracycline transcriptional repressor